MPNVQHKRGTRSALTTLAGSSGLLTGQVYLLTDEEHRPAVAKSSSAFETVALESDLSAGWFPNLVSLSSGVTVTDTAYADITGLSFDVVNGGTYWFSAHVAFTTSAGTNGTRWSINGPATTWLQYTSDYTLSQAARTVNGGLFTYDRPTTSNVTSVVGGSTALITGMLLAAADGTVIVRAGSEDSAQSITARAGSFVLWKRML